MYPVSRFCMALDLNICSVAKSPCGCLIVSFHIRSTVLDECFCLYFYMLEATLMRQFLSVPMCINSTSSLGSPSTSTAIKPLSSPPSPLSASRGFFGSSLCIATYMADPKINDDPMIERAPGVVPHTNLSNVSAKSICM